MNKLNNFNIMDGMQRFGAAMFVPVGLFPIAGLLLAVIQIVKNPMLVGGLATYAPVQQLLFVFEQGAWAAFRVIPIVFALGFPIAMAKKAPARAVMVTVITLLAFHNMINAILSQWGSQFGVDFDKPVGSGSGLAMIMSVKTLDLNIVGGILIGSITTKIHNTFFDKKLPESLGFFQGTALVAFIALLVCFPLAFFVCWVWPPIQNAILGLQGFMVSAGTFGVWLYVFLERLLIPTGLHHFIYAPFTLGDAAVAGGLKPYWLAHINEYAASTLPLKQLFPYGFLMQGNSKIFGAMAMVAAMILAVQPQNRKKIMGVLIPAGLTAFLTGVTEPLEFTFLFVAPLLFVVHAFLGAVMSALMFAMGVVGAHGNGLDALTMFWLPMFANHSGTVFLHLFIGLIFSAIYFFTFYFLITKLNLPTPGREASEIKLYTKAEYKEKVKAEQLGNTHNGSYLEQAKQYLLLLGGKENITAVTNCATRLRVTVADPTLVADLASFRAVGASGMVTKGLNYQIIVGVTVPNVRDEFDRLIDLE